jgi:hypothetical protein
MSQYLHVKVVLCRNTIIEINGVRMSKLEQKYKELLHSFFLTYAMNEDLIHEIA